MVFQDRCSTECFFSITKGIFTIWSLKKSFHLILSGVEIIRSQSKKTFITSVLLLQEVIEFNLSYKYLYFSIHDVGSVEILTLISNNFLVLIISYKQNKTLDFILWTSNLKIIYSTQWKFSSLCCSFCVLFHFNVPLLQKNTIYLHMSMMAYLLCRTLA